MPMPKGRLGIGAPGRVICTPPLLPIVSTFTEPPRPLQKINFNPDALISLFWIICITSLVQLCHLFLYDDFFFLPCAESLIMIGCRR
ncbi:hypothetical protein Peur_020394 [Populus x canadensis]